MCPLRGIILDHQIKYCRAVTTHRWGLHLCSEVALSSFHNSWNNPIGPHGPKTLFLVFLPWSGAWEHIMMLEDGKSAGIVLEGSMFSIASPILRRGWSNLDHPSVFYFSGILLVQSKGEPATSWCSRRQNLALNLVIWQWSSKSLA